MLNCVYKVIWTEHERGWGCRPDGVSYHKTKEFADIYIKNYWDKQPSGAAPDEYSSPGTPNLAEVSLTIWEEVQEKGSIRQF